MSEHLLAETPLSSLEPGLNLLQKERLVIYLGEDGKVCATHNRCQHQGAKMVKTGNHTMRCPRHGWELDASTMCYRNPQGGVKQALLHAVQQNGTLRIFDAPSRTPWGTPQARPALGKGELSLRFYAHACLEIIAGTQRIFTDPWLQGPAFIRGWWLTEPPPSDWMERLRSSDSLVISHSHSDHLNPPTLRALHALRPDIPIYIPAFDSGSCARELSQLGFRNLHLCPVDSWVDFPGGLRLMLLQDQSHREDSAMLFEYKGRRIFNTVDCHNLGPALPRDIDVLLTQFAGGASGYPVCWNELLGSAKVDRIVQRNRVAMRRSVLEYIERCHPQVYAPFANYFVEAHPADKAIQDSNQKNTAESVCNTIRDNFPGVRQWIPESGSTLDLAHYEVEAPAPIAALHSSTAPYNQEISVPAKPGTATGDMDHWLAEIDQDADFAPLDTLEGIQAYFDWAAYRGDLVLHVLETSEDFRETFREFFVDFRSGQVCESLDGNDTPYLRMKVRRSVFRHALRRGLPWEEISIGFQARFYREPDIYHFDFWNHFQNHLPKKEITWPSPINT